MGDCRKAFGSGLNLAPLLPPFAYATAFSRSLLRRWVCIVEKSTPFDALFARSDRLIFGDSQAFPLSLRFLRSVDENFLECVFTVPSEGNSEFGFECE